jgi:hypothetical protein
MTGTRARQAARHKILEIRFQLDAQAQAMKNADDAIGLGKDSKIVQYPTVGWNPDFQSLLETGLSDAEDTSPRVQASVAS